MAAGCDAKPPSNPFSSRGVTSWPANPMPDFRPAGPALATGLSDLRLGGAAARRATRYIRCDFVAPKARSSVYGKDVLCKKGNIMNKDTMEGQWKQLSGKAKIAWGKLTDDELTQINGDAERLAGLVQERYGRTREEAEREVRDFFDQNR